MKKASSVFINLETSNGPLTIGSQYAAPSKDALSEWSSLLANLDSKSSLFMGADLNAWSPLWGYDREDERGSKLIEHCFEHDLFIIHDRNSAPTFSIAGINGWPDVSLLKSNDVLSVKDWKVLNRESLSDHRYVQTTLETMPTRIRPNRYRTQYGNHVKLRKHLKVNLQRLPTRLEDVHITKQLDSYTADLIIAIQKASDRAYRKKCHKSHRRFTWWTPELSAQRSRP